MEILIKVKIVIAVECSLASEFAFAVLISSAVVPHRIRPIHISSDIIRDIRYNELCLWYLVLLEVLEAVMVELAPERAFSFKWQH